MDNQPQSATTDREQPKLFAPDRPDKIDPELVAMATVLDALRTLDAAARSRVLGWALDRVRDQDSPF